MCHLCPHLPGDLFPFLTPKAPSQPVPGRAQSPLFDLQLCLNILINLIRQKNIWGTFAREAGEDLNSSRDTFFHKSGQGDVPWCFSWSTLEDAAPVGIIAPSPISYWMGQLKKQNIYLSLWILFQYKKPMSTVQNGILLLFTHVDKKINL